MQDPSAFTLPTQLQQQQQPQFPEHEQLRCPRCDSTNTKFCYYNNYNLSQPRHFCKSCRRYWTKGGTLRNIPVGGGTRKTPSKRSSSSSSSPSSHSLSSKRSSSTTTSPPPSSSSPPAEAPSNSLFTPPGPKPENTTVTSGPGLGTDGFRALLGPNGQFGNLFEGLGSVGFGSGMGSGPSPMVLQNRGSDANNATASSCWGDGSNNGWPDLAIYTPGSKLQ